MAKKNDKPIEYITFATRTAVTNGGAMKTKIK